MGERINREKYIYEVAHKQRPADKVTFFTLTDVMHHTGLWSWSIYENINKGHTIGGWIITRTKIEKPKPKPKKDMKGNDKGVLVYMADGRTLTFESQSKCAMSLGISQSCIFKHLKDGTPDRSGNFFDYPFLGGAND